MRVLLILLLSALVAPTAAQAATVPLGSRTFDQACQAASAGDVITVPAGSLGQQSVSCAKQVTFQGAGAITVLSYLTVRGSGATFTGMRSTGGADIEAVSNVTFKNMVFNNQVYLERDDTIVFDHSTWEPSSPGAAAPDQDFLDIYSAASSNSTQPNKNITVQDSIFHGLRSPTTTAHPDAIQLYNEGPPHTGIRILRNRFYDNECINLRANPKDELLLENNVFGDSVNGISGCGYYSLDVGYAQVTARYNTFTGIQQIQQTPTVSGLKQVWVGNAGVGFSAGCTSGGAAGSAHSHNVWSGQSCTGDTKAPLNIAAGGSPNSGSPLIDKGDPSVFPATDIDGRVRPAGLAPDVGALETAGVTPPPPADRDGDGVPDSQDACPDMPGTQADGCNPPPPPPSCASQLAALQAQLDAANGKIADAQSALTQTRADLAAMTTSRDNVQALADAYKARAEKAEDQVARIRTITGE